MAHLVEGGTEGTETGTVDVAPQAVDINQWLKSNRLSQLKDYFEKIEIEMEGILNPYGKIDKIVYYRVAMNRKRLDYRFRIGHLCTLHIQ